MEKKITRGIMKNENIPISYGDVEARSHFSSKKHQCSSSYSEREILISHLKFLESRLAEVLSQNHQQQLLFQKYIETHSLSKKEKYEAPSQETITHNFSEKNSPPKKVLSKNSRVQALPYIHNFIGGIPKSSLMNKEQNQEAVSSSDFAIKKATPISVPSIHSFVGGLNK